MPALRLLVVSDLHLEKGSSFARRGMLVPPYDTAATLLALQAVDRALRAAHRRQPGRQLSRRRGRGAPARALSARGLLALMAGRDWFWVAGNHDPEPPADLPGDDVARTRGRRAAFPPRAVGAAAAEARSPAISIPCARIVQRGRSVRRRCFASDGCALIMPAFGAYTGSLNVLDRAYAGLFRRERLMAYMLGDSAHFPDRRRAAAAGLNARLSPSGR